MWIQKLLLAPTWFVDYKLGLKTEKEPDLFNMFHLMRVGDVNTKTDCSIGFLFV